MGPQPAMVFTGRMLVVLMVPMVYALSSPPPPPPTPPGEPGAAWSSACGADGAGRLAQCLQRLPEILSGARQGGIPASKKDLLASCSAFKTGMGCVQRFASACLSPQERQLVHDQVAGANYTFHFLCDDGKFQAEYLQYTSCYRGMSREWESCADRVMALVQEEMARRNASEHERMVELCCAKYGFLRCVYAASRRICRKEEALFLNRIAETLSAFQFYTPVCRSMDVAVCMAPCAPRPRVMTTLAPAALLLLLPLLLRASRP